MNHGFGRRKKGNEVKQNSKTFCYTDLRFILRALFRHSVDLAPERQTYFLRSQQTEPMRVFVSFSAGKHRSEVDYVIIC